MAEERLELRLVPGTLPRVETLLHQIHGLDFRGDMLHLLIRSLTAR